MVTFKDINIFEVVVKYVVVLKDIILVDLVKHVNIIETKPILSSNFFVPQW